MAMQNSPKSGSHGTRHTLRVGDAEREDATRQLKEHFAAGRLDLEEFIERVGSALTAKTQGQISRLLADLPRLNHPQSLPKAPVQVPAPDDEPGLISRYAAVALLAILVLLWMTAVTLLFRNGYHMPASVLHH